MNYKNYKKGYSALRRIINDEELEFSRQFAKFNFSFSQRYQMGRQMRGIYNVKTNNVVAFVNNRGNVFVRPASTYADALIYGSKNKVIKNSNMRAIRGHVDGHIKRYALTNLFAENAADKLIENKDKPNKVFLGKVDDNSNMDMNFFNKVLKEKLDKDKFKNTLYAIKENAMTVERLSLDQETNKHRIYLDVLDYSDAIAQEEKVERVKQEIAVAFTSNIMDIAQHSIITNSSMNPLQFSYTVDDETFTGVIKLNRIDMAYPPDMPVSDWLKPQDIVRYIDFTERVGSLAERGIDEMQQREERDSRQRIMNIAYDQYVDYIRATLGDTIRVPRFENVQRADLEAMAMPSPLDTTAFYQEYTEPDTPMTSA